MECFDSKNKDFEFDAKFEDHPLGSQNVYRLHYVNYHRFGEGYGIRDNNVGFHDCPFKPFLLPQGMNRENTFKVLSYLTDYIESNFDIQPCSYKSVTSLDSIINMERFGFTRLSISNDDADIIDLFKVTGRLLLFKQIKYYSKYFEWYTENVTFEAVKKIYDECNIPFYDLVIKE